MVRASEHESTGFRADLGEVATPETAPPPMPDTSPASADPAEDLLRFFAFEHLPPALAEISRPFAELAHHVASSSPRSAERTMALRKLLEAKDCAVRAQL